MRILRIIWQKVTTKLDENIRGIEKEYTTILGIFASIVLAFVGGMTFTTSTLQNIDKSNIFKILIVIAMIGLVLINLIKLLILFIFEINHISDEPHL